MVALRSPLNDMNATQVTPLSPFLPFSRYTNLDLCALFGYMVLVHVFPGTLLGGDPSTRHKPYLPSFYSSPCPHLSVEEDDAVSAVSELEVREWIEEHGAGSEEPVAGGEPPLFPPTPDFMASAEAG